MTNRVAQDRADGVLERLTAAERKLSGKAIQRIIVETAAPMGWWWVHWRSAPKPGGKGWGVPVEGTLGVGWPDVFLLQPVSRRLLAIEVKAYGDELTDAQRNVLAMLQAAGVETYVLGPADVRDPLEGSRLVAILMTPPAWMPRAVLAEIAAFEDKTIRMLRRHGIVFDRWPPAEIPPGGWTPENMAALDTETRWQGIAFTLYTDLVLGAANVARKALEDLDENVDEVLRKA